MTAKELGEEPAYPIVASTGDPRDGVYCRNGLTKREEFAKAMLAGIASNEDNPTCPASRIIEFEKWRDEILSTDAMYAVRLADALLAELAKEKP